MARLLLLTGTCGSGKTTISTLLAQEAGWIRLGEDEIWESRFGTNRGPFLSSEHRYKRQQVHAILFRDAIDALRSAFDVVIDATVHETPPEEFAEYCAFFGAHAIDLRVRVLSPRLDVAIARDATRACWTVGENVVRDMSAKFNGSVFGTHRLVDNSDESPKQTMNRILTLESANASFTNWEEK